MKVGSGLPLFKSREQERVLEQPFVFADSPISLSGLTRRAATWRRRYRWIVDAVLRGFSLRVRELVMRGRERSRAIDHVFYLWGLHRRTGRRRPVAVFTMGKVGSTSLAATAREALDRSSLHCHWVTPGGIRDARRFDLRYDATLIRQRWNGEYLRWRFRIQRGQRWDIICGVREPVAREVSFGFQNAERYGLLVDGGSVKRMVDHVVERIDYQFGREADWFRRELEAVTGIDVCSVPFDHDAGYGTYSNDRFRILLVRFEDLNRQGSRALGEFFSIDDPPLARENIGASKEYSDLYERFRRYAVIPERSLDLAYSARWVRHFYRPEELERARERWSDGRPPT